MVRDHLRHTRGNVLGGRSHPSPRLTDREVGRPNRAWNRDRTSTRDHMPLSTLESPAGGAGREQSETGRHDPPTVPR